MDGNDKYVLTDTSARTVMWLGVIAYIVTLITYIMKIGLYYINPNFENLVKYGILILGYTLLSISQIKKTRQVQKDRRYMETPEFFFSKLTRIGWVCMIFHFVSLYVFASKTYWYYAVAFIAYILLVMSQKVGVYMSASFYILSLVLMFNHPVIDYITIPSKTLNMLFMASYSYIFYKQYLRERKKKLE
jgi:hypothetical protein